MGGKKKSSNQKNCGNGIVEMEGKKKIVAMALPKQKEKKNCGNGIAEIEGKKNVVAPKIGGVNQLITSPLHLILIPKYLEYILWGSKTWALAVGLSTIFYQQCVR